MSVIAPMDMPRSCSTCVFMRSEFSTGERFCWAKGLVYGESKLEVSDACGPREYKRHEKCPLVPYTS